MVRNVKHAIISAQVQCTVNMSNLLWFNWVLLQHTKRLTYTIPMMYHYQVSLIMVHFL